MHFYLKFLVSRQNASCAVTYRLPCSIIRPEEDDLPVILKLVYNSCIKSKIPFKTQISLKGTAYNGKQTKDQIKPDNNNKQK